MFEPIVVGSANPYPPVDLKIMRIDVIGARTMPANTAPMPTTAKAPNEPRVVEDRHIQVAHRPAEHPSHKQRRGRLPPAPPLEYDVTVAASLSTHKGRRVTGRLPSRACVRVL